MTDLGTLDGLASTALAINASGVVLGHSGSDAFLYSGGMISPLGSLGGFYSAGRAMNDLGQVAGYAYTEFNERHAFIYSSGVMMDLTSLGSGDSEARAINNVGVVVGTRGVFGRAFIYRDGVMRDINQGVPPGYPILEWAIAINDAGQILCEEPSGRTCIPSHPGAPRLVRRRPQRAR